MLQVKDSPQDDTSPQVEAPPTLLSFRQFIVKFFQPLNKKYRFWTIGASVIIGIGLYVFVDIELAELVRQNSHPLQLLAMEQLIELGPNYTGEGKRYVEIIDDYYTKHLEQRHYAAVALRVLYPNLSPQKALASARGTLDNAKEGEAAEAIWQAGIATNELHKLCKRFPRSPIVRFESEKLPIWLKEALEKAFIDFHKQVIKLEGAQTLAAAETECKTACRYSREGLILLSLARLGYDGEEKIEKIKSFQRDLERATRLAQKFAERAKREKDEKRRTVFSGRTRNMGIRVDVVQAMLANDMDSVTKRLNEEIERALADREERKHN